MSKNPEYTAQRRHKTNRQIRDEYLPRALELRLQGEHYHDIADIISEEMPEGVTRSGEAVRNWINDHLKERAKERDEAGEQLVEYQHQKLVRQERQIQATLERIDRELDEIEPGENVTGASSLLAERRRSIRALQKINESIRKLFGIDAPKESRLTVEKRELKLEIAAPPKPDQIEDGGEAEVLDAEFEPHEEDIKALKEVHDDA